MQNSCHGQYRSCSGQVGPGLFRITTIGQYSGPAGGRGKMAGRAKKNPALAGFFCRCESGLFADEQEQCALATSNVQQELFAARSCQLVELGSILDRMAIDGGDDITGPQ